MDVRLENPGGLTGVWAEENTRASLWDAMYRKETFGVSGPHIKVRFFGGWGYGKDILGRQGLGEAVVRGRRADGRRPAADAVGRQGHGAELRRLGGEGPDLRQSRPHPDHQGLDAERPELREGLRRRLGRRPQARQVDRPGAGHPEHGGPREGHLHQRRRLGGAEDGVDAIRSSIASLHAFYYARVLEIPTPRWTLIQAVKSGLPPPDIVPLTGQERAWSSPIWYTPSAEARKNAPAGMTVADLKKKGATALSDAQLKALIVGKAFWLRNNVTGEQFSQNFTTEGQTIVFRVGRNATMPSGFGNVVRDGYQGTTTPYKIEGGKLVTLVSQDPYAFTFYKLGDTYYAARSNEFGYANYEIIPAPQIAVNPLTELSQPVLDRAGADGAAEAADRSDPEGRAHAAGGAEEGHLAQRPEEGRAAAGDRRVLRREDHAAAQCGAAAEVPALREQMRRRDDRGDGRARRCRRWKRTQCSRRHGRECRAGSGADCATRSS